MSAMKALIPTLLIVIFRLVVVHGVNGQMMEKYYLICSAVLAMILVIPPYAAGQYGWDPLEQDCWYTNDNRKHRIIWQIATQMGWTSLAVLGEVICSFFVLVFMLKHTGRIRRVFVPARSVSQTSSAPQVFHANRYRSIIFRVALYPIVSCFVNLISVVTALHSTFSNGIQDRTDYNVLLLSDFLYGGRAIVYALLALSDPALVRACREFYSRAKTDSTTGQSTGQSSLSHSHSFHKSRPTQVFVELSTFSPQTDVSPVAVEAAKSGASLADGSSDLEQQQRTDNSQYHHDDKSTPSPTPTPTPLEQPKSQTHGMVGFVEDSESPPTMAGTQIQRRHTRRGARHQSEGDAFERQI
ncbi:hypothetical protein ONZ45_g8086 [Pleurotus djamor]|nr:hypothetical protein ONZ45_g8086 [Pleurotus djamor]